MHMRTRTPGSAPGKGLLAMNDDIIHSILCQLPDPGTLCSVAMSCKAMYKYVYGENAKGILRSVTSNASGSPACLEAAVRAVLIQRALEDSPKCATADIVALGDVQEDIQQEALKPWVFAALDDRLAVGRALEVVYSRSCKDRVPNRNSVLSPSESNLFQTALHRAWLISSVYDHDVLQRAPGDPTWRIGTTCNRLLLSGLPAAELAAFATIWRWMASIFYDPVPPGSFLGGRTKCVVLARGPRGALQLLQVDRYEAERYDILFEHRSRIHLDALLSECDALLPPALRAPDPRLGPDTAIFTRGILSAVVGAGDCCTKCGEQAGLALWNVENASSPPRDLQRSTLCRHLSGFGHVDFHPEENLTAFYKRIEGYELERIKLSGEAFSPSAGVDFALGRVIREILEIEDAASLVQRGLVLPDEDVTPQSLLCAKCLVTVLDRRLRSWWCIQTDPVSDAVRNRKYWLGFQQLDYQKHGQQFNNYDVFNPARKAATQKKRAKKRAARAQAASLKHSLDDDVVSPAATADKS